MALSQAFNTFVGVTPGQRFRRLAAVFLLASAPVAVIMYNRHDNGKSENAQEPETRQLKNAWEDSHKLCLEGCPVGAPSSNRVVEHNLLVLSNNGQTKFADWEAYVVSPATIGTTKTRVWHRDPALPKDETLSPGDYKGAREALGIDRGHQAPLASLTGAQGWEEANYLSNITPQSIDLNEGAWENLERAERKLAMEAGSVHTVTGTLYERDMPQLPHARLTHKIPSGYWKVIAVGNGDNIQVAAFIMDQNLSRDADYCAQSVTVRVVETRARLNLFPNLKKSTQESIEKAPGKLPPKLGCR